MSDQPKSRKTEALQKFLDEYEVSKKWDKNGATSIIVMAFEIGWESALEDPEMKRKAKELGALIMKVQEAML